MSKDDEKEADTHHEGNEEKSVAVTPIQLLGIIIRIALKDRSTDDEVETICSVYYETVEE